MTDPVRVYRESAVRGASPVGLIVILYEEIIRSLRRAQRAIRSGQIQERTNALTHAINVIGHLRGVLNFEKGGRVAAQLAVFYDLMQAQILSTNIAPTEAAFETLIAAFTTVKETWQVVDREVSCGAGEGDALQLAAAVKFTASVNAAEGLSSFASTE
jgi:flagellar secretion chaperone FliS